MKLKHCSRLPNNFIQDWLFAFFFFFLWPFSTIFLFISVRVKTTQGLANKLPILTKVCHMCGPNKQNFGTVGEYHNFTNTVKSLYGNGHQSHVCLWSQHSEKLTASAAKKQISTLLFIIILVLENVYTQPEHSWNMTLNGERKFITHRQQTKQCS